MFRLPQMTVMFLVVLGLLFGSGGVLAQDQLQRQTASTSDGVTIQAQEYLWEGISGIEDNKNGTVDVWGSTKAYQNVDLISVTLYLQVYDSGSWKTVSKWVYDDINSASVQGLDQYPIQPGKKYRVHGVHEIWEGADYEGATTTTGWIIPQ